MRYDHVVITKRKRAIIMAKDHLQKDIDEIGILERACAGGLFQNMVGLTQDTPDLGSWEDLTPAPTRRMTDAEYKDYISKK